MPKFEAFVLLPAYEDLQALGFLDSDGIIGECNGAIGVAEGANPNKGVGRGWHNMAIAGGIGRELREIKAAAGCGFLDLGCGGAYVGGWFG